MHPEPPQQQVLELLSSDGAKSTLTVYPSANPEAPALLCLPAMGIEARFYAGFAQTLVRGGVHAAVLDLRGLGTSSVRASRQVDFSYATIVDEDLPVAWEALLQRFPRSAPFLLGHSLGGQVATLFLAKGEARARGLVLVASGTPWFRLWPFPLGQALYGVGLTFPLLARLLGYFPGGRFAFAGRESVGVISDWARIVRTGKMAPAGWDPASTERALASLEIPILGVSIEKDLFTPRPVLDHMLGMLPNARIERFHYDHRAFGEPAVDHVRWPKHPRIIAEQTIAWMRTILEPSPPEAEGGPSGTEGGPSIR